MPPREPPQLLPRPLVDGGAADTSAAPPAELSTALQTAAVFAATGCLVGLLVIQLAGTSEYVPFNYFVRQDVWWLIALGVFCIAYSFHQPHAVLAPVTRLVRAMPLRTLVAFGVFVFVAMVGGTYLIHHNHNRTLDEVLVHFDAQIFRHGQLFAGIPETWRLYTKAMMPAFGLPVSGGAAWVSAYLPGNAAFQALVGWVAPLQLANPLLSALAIGLTWSVARTIWPEHRDAAVVAVLLMLTSAQVLFMAMTSWAMAGHLALTMLWLRLYLRQDFWGHAGCLVTGFIACGWHQVAFHALFVAPFVLSFWLRRRWMLALVYSGIYTLVGIFWISYGQSAASLSGLALAPGSSSGLKNFAAVVASLAETLSISSLVMMGFNLLRFFAWQNLILLPLLILAWRTTRRLPDVLRLSLAGLGLTLAVILIVLPYQGHGWGYRYLHAYIGVLCLVAAHAWLHALALPAKHRGEVWTPIAASIALSMLIQWPGQAWQVHAQVGPRAVAMTAIERAKAAVVIVDPRGILNPGDLVRNDPYLAAGKPIVMDLYEMNAERIAGLCARARTITVFDDANPAASGVRTTIKVSDTVFATLQKTTAEIRSLPCFVPWPGGTPT